MVVDMDRTLLCGRERHLQVLTDAIDDARRGRARTVTLHGDAGSGKTALLGAVAAAAEERMRVIRVSGHPAEQDLPLAGVDQLVRQAELAHGPAADDDSDPLRNAAALLDAVTTRAKREPILIVVDDAQWLDRLSRRALIFVARRLRADAVCMLFAVRSPVTENLQVGTELAVDPLSAEDSVQLLRQTHPTLSARVAAKIAAHARGLPLALREIPADLSAAQRRGAQPLPVDLPVGRSLARMFEPRIADLPDATRLCMLAAAFDPLTAYDYRSVLTELECRLGDLDAAERAGLVQVREGRCEFRHPLAAAAMRAAARTRERVAVHRALARRFDHDPVRRARHLRHDPEIARDTLLAALQDGAAAAAAAQSHDEAAELWQAAAELVADPKHAGELQRNAVRCLAQAGWGSEAQAVIEQLLTETTDAAERVHVLQDLTWLSLWTRSVAPRDDEMIEAHSVELLTADVQGARSLGQALLASLATAMLGAGQYRRAQQAAHALLALADDHLTVEQSLLCDVIAVMTGEPGAGRRLGQADAWVDSYPWRRILDPAWPAGFITVVLAWLGEDEPYRDPTDAHRARHPYPPPE